MAAHEDGPAFACLANPVDTVSPAATLSGNLPDQHAMSRPYVAK
jgi:hypothetical protein